MNYSNKEEETFHRNYLPKSGIRIMEFPEIANVKGNGKKQFIKRLLYPQFSDYFPYSNDVLKSILQDEAVKLLVAFGWDAVALVHPLKNVFKVASIVDLLGKHFELRKQSIKQYHGFQRIIEYLSIFGARKREQFALQSLRNFYLILEHAYHHTQELTNMGYQNVVYLPHPIPEPDKEKIAEKYEKRTENSVRILIPGSLKGVSSRLGFDFFINEVLSRLANKDIKDPYQFRIVGHGKLPESIKASLEKQRNVRIIGFVEDIEKEYVNADIVLVNVPVEQGFRTRIADAFSYGCCVVAHSANCAGMPEVSDGVNALTAEDPDLFVQKLIAAITKPELRKQIGDKAKETFEKQYAIKVATKKLADLLQL
jgi:glycosyltransferase involved in cell wall biosynthesis